MLVVDNADDWMRNRSVQSLSLWAKSGNEDGYLCLPQHLIDTACVAEWLWANWVSDSLKTSLSSSWDLSAEQVRTLFCFFAGTHDVGKATVTFQRLVERRPDERRLLGPIEDAGLSLEWPQGEGPDRRFPHGMASALLLRNWLADHGVNARRRVALSAVVDAHHGFTSNAVVLRNFSDAISGRLNPFDDLVTELIDAMAELTNIEPVLDAIGDADVPVADALQLMTGLVIMADWIASNENAFPYTPLIPQRARLAQAIAYIGLPRPWSPVEIPSDDEELFQRTFGWPAEYQLRPVQRTAVELSRKSVGPTLMIIEAPTGEGKTEAGLAAAHVLSQKSGAQGVFFAAPTMSTANGLFDRTANWASKSSEAGEVVSMFLAHSKNRLSKPFQKMRFQGIGEDLPEENSGDDSPRQNSGSVIAASWLSGRKTGVLSDFVVGTVDQVLMMALQARHSMLRHVGLAGKVVIIDEVHAYDAYMSQYLYCTLEWLARYGVNVILMSATLPPAQRKRLAQAYACQLIDDAETAVEALDSTSYPLVSIVDTDGVRPVEVQQRPVNQQVAVTIIDDSLAELATTLKAKLTDGGVALVICNTIARSQEAFHDLKRHFPEEVELHHSAFIAAHRSEKEDLLREELGPKARRGHDRPWRRIVVATQVAEQSLDIDADLLVTDLAPIDLIIQRAGRVHRHDRPESDRPTQLNHPQILLRAIKAIGTVPEFDGGAAAIYGEKLLLSTMAHLPQSFCRPKDVADLVRKVYTAEPDIPTEWRDAWETACSEDFAKRSSAELRAQSYRMPSPTHAEHLSSLFAQLHENSETIGGEEQGNAQVRDAEFSVEVIALQNTDYGYIPLGGGLEILNGSEVSKQAEHQLAANTLRLPTRLTRRESDFDTVIDELEQQTPEEWTKSGMLRGQVALRFDDDARAQLGRFALSYDAESGLRVEAK